MPTWKEGSGQGPVQIRARSGSEPFDGPGQRARRQSYGVGEGEGSLVTEGVAEGLAEGEISV